MFGFFKKKTPIDILNEKYQKLMEESFKLSKTDRKAADAKVAEAELVLKEIDSLS